jgi:YesN/AraC family two-component response regulator
MLYNLVMNDKKVTKYVKTPLSSVFNVRAVYTIHYFKYGQQFAFEGERHPFWEFVYIDSGTAKILAEDHEFDLCQGEGYFHKPDEYHSIKTDNNFANSVIISFECLSPTMRAFENCRITLSQPEKDLLGKIVNECSKCYSDKLNALYLSKMHPIADAPFGGQQLIKLYVEQLLLFLHRSLTSGEKQKSESHRTSFELTDKIKEILENNVYGNVSLDEIASTLFFSKTYIKTVFKKNTGQSIMQYFTSLKIDEAKKLISYNKYTFTEIAYKLGYSSLYYFSRQFKKNTTMSLTEYAGTIKVDGVL